MANYAKWIGGALGWAFAGPIGALLGYAFGNVLGQVKNGMGQAYTAGTQPGDFAASLLVLSAAVVKADGKIEKAEIEYVKHFYERQFGQRLTEQYMVAMQNILSKDFSTKEVCQQILKHMDYSSRVQLIHYLFGIAKSDNHVAKEEVNIIFTISMDMGVSSADFESIQAMFFKSSESAYKILEITPQASVAEIKKAYRSMAVKFHPDKVTHLGEEFQKAAHEKFQKVNEAYESIKKERSFN